MRKDNNEPLLVQIPETGQFIDVRPFIHFFTQESFESIDNASEVMDIIADEHIRLLSMRVRFIDEMNIKEDHMHMVSLFTTLHALKDLAKNTTLFNSNKRRTK